MKQPIEFVHVESLIWYDGPLLSVLQRYDGVLELEHWWNCDNDAQTSHWLFYQVTPENLALYKNKEISIREVMKRASYMREEGYNENGCFSSRPVIFDELPEDQLPTVDSFYDEILAP